MDTVKLLNYMENLRYDRKMTQEVYLFDVISQRQYYRYRSGESEIPFEVIIKLANKLQIPLLKLISTFQTHTAKEAEFVNHYLNLVMNKQLDEARSFIRKKKNLMLLDDEIRVFYQIGTMLYKFFSHQSTIDEVVIALKQMADYENVMKKEVLHDSEIYLLGVIMEYSDEDRETILEKIIQLRKNDKLLLGGNILFNAQVFFWVIKNLGRMNKYIELIDVAEEAIEYNKKFYSYYSNEYFYYYKSLANYRLGKLKNFESDLTQAIIFSLHLSEYKRKHFIETIKKDTETDCKKLILNKIEKEF